ncbi:MAG: ribose 5-phosphate isomerase B [Cyanobacteria bacterium]|nr:ribose 5-phosphate isomerase B [Cyanobacteriota bacterium]
MQDRIALGSDHAGFAAKEEIKKLLEGEGIEFEDLGTHSTDSCDYPDYARRVAESVADGRFPRGILCCGSGIGVSIVANKVKGIRAALCRDSESAKLSRQHNDANVLCIAARMTSADDLKEIINQWLSTEFEGGRHKSRVDKIEEPQAGESQSWYSIH